MFLFIFVRISCHSVRSSFKVTHYYYITVNMWVYIYYLSYKIECTHVWYKFLFGPLLLWKKKKTDQNQLSGRKGLFQLLLYRPSMMEASARTQGRSLASKHWSRSCGGVLLTGLFSIACSPHFLIPSRIQEEKEIEF